MQCNACASAATKEAKSVVSLRCWSWMPRIIGYGMTMGRRQRPRVGRGTIGEPDWVFREPNGSS